MFELTTNLKLKRIRLLRHFNKITAGVQGTEDEVVSHDNNNNNNDAMAA